jgi:DNA polymerase III delta subunit
MGFRFTTPIVVSFGEEPFFLDRDIKMFGGATGYAITYLDGNDVNGAKVVHSCTANQINFDDLDNSPTNLVIVDNAQKIKIDKALKSYLENTEASDLSSILVAVFRAASVTGAWSKLGPKAVIREYKKLKTWDDNNEVVKWVQDEAARLGLKIDNTIGTFMYKVAGDDLYRLSSEVHKLKLLLGKGTVTKEHLDLVMTPTSNLASWDVADSVFLKNWKKALVQVAQIFKYASEDPSLMILGALIKGVERLFVTRSLLDKGVPPDDIAGRLGMHPYRFKKAVLPQAERQTVARLVSNMQMLSRLDVELKRTSHRRTLVELAVYELAS